MVKIPLSLDIEPEAFRRFHEMCDVLPVNKNEVMALMIRVFDALPAAIQDQLCSKRPGATDAALEKLSHIGSLQVAVDTLVEDADTSRKGGRRRRASPKAG